MRPCVGIRAQMLKHQSRRIEVAIKRLLDNALPDCQAGRFNAAPANIDATRASAGVARLTGLELRSKRKMRCCWGVHAT
jgi:hypothetical protein